MEQWKKIEGFENYSVSTKGRVRNDRTGVIYVGRANKRGYFDIHLRRNNKRERRYIHRLVAEAFIPNPNNYPCVNHIDENKSNNASSNLEWCTYMYNNQHGTRLNRIAEIMKTSMLGNRNGGKRVIVDDVEYRSYRDAAKHIGSSDGIFYRKHTEYKGHKIKYIQ